MFHEVLGYISAATIIVLAATSLAILVIHAVKIIKFEYRAVHSVNLHPTKKKRS